MKVRSALLIGWERHLWSINLKTFLSRLFQSKKNIEFSHFQESLGCWQGVNSKRDYDEGDTKSKIREKLKTISDKISFYKVPFSHSHYYTGLDTWQYQNRSLIFPFNPYPWILVKNPNRGAVSERVSRRKYPEHSVASFVYVSVLWIFFRKTRSVTLPKIGIYFCSARHISLHIDICHLILASK